MTEKGDADAWLETKLADVQKTLRRPTSGTRKEDKARLLTALATVYEIIRCSRFRINSDRNEALERALVAHYDGMRRPREGTNPLVPIVRMCFPKKTASDRHRYVGLLSYWSIKKLKIRAVRQVIDEGADYGINVLSRKGHKLWREKGQPNFDLIIEWTLLAEK